LYEENRKDPCLHAIARARFLENTAWYLEYFSGSAYWNATQILNTESSKIE
jgi:hypothetical protein